MTTLTAPTPTAPTTPRRAVRTDPTAGLRARPGLREIASQTVSMAWRSWKKMIRNPEQFSDVTIQPIMFTAMFGYIFGGAIAGGVGDYLTLLVPGMLTMTALTACMATGVQLREDMDKGVFDRFRSLPMARVTILAGPMLADLLRWALAGAFTLGTGIAMGYRPDVGGAIAALALTVFAGWSIAWVFTWVGSIARTAESVQGISMMVMFPLVFLSSAFVPTDTLPGWLQAFVKVNPVSHVAAALRDLANHSALTGEVGWAIVGCAAVVAIFIPLTVKTLGRKL